jgi:UDP-N-acetylglucosamine 2-epimerase (non-hydrolysing)
MGRRLRVLAVIGTRPEVIKMAPVITALRAHKRDALVRICSTGQHREMLDPLLRVFGLRPHVYLGLMRPEQSLATLSARALLAMERVIAAERPDVVIIQGDTTTAMAAGLATFLARVKIGHIEAGLRTYDRFAPFPEEVNRRVVSAVADFHFAPTVGAREALVREGIDPSTIFVTGNTIIDSLLETRRAVRRRRPQLPTCLASIVHGKRVILVTGHRRENFGDGFEAICAALIRIADAEPDVEIVYPVHMNPSVRAPVMRLLGSHPRIHLIEPLSYPGFVWLLDRAFLVLTDSGGVQEEAPSLGKPVLVMRDTTERPEGVAAGGVKLVGADEERILRGALRLLRNRTAYEAMAQIRHPYGDGRAGKRIARVLISKSGSTARAAH